jgi:hypothetical protein
MADDVHGYYDRRQSNTYTDSQPHAGYSRRGQRGRLDEFARARSLLAQAPAGAGAGLPSGGTTSVAAGEQRQERGLGTP